MVSKILQLDESTISESAVRFSSEQGILVYVELAIKTTREIFTDAEKIATCLKRDEYGEQYVEINAVVYDNPDCEAEKYSACVEKWSSLIPPQVGNKIQLSTSWAL